jgi:tetratricopeptide (TPR) repeat protein
VHPIARALLIIAPLLPAPLTAQNAASPIRLQAESASAPKDFARAATLYQQVVAAAPGNAAAWNALGASWYQLGRFAQAADAYDHAFRTGAGPFARYNAAASYARAGNAGSALTTLDSLARGGFALPVLLQGDSDFVALRPDPRYQSALAMMQRNATPCASEPKARQLDFWVGEWDVTGPRGPAGRSSVQLILGSCIVFENWAGRLGDSGKSFNVYNAATDEWQQYWVANRLQGANLFTQGIYADGKLQYRHSEFKGAGGKMHLRRLAFFNLDPEHVRQLSEASADGGATWTTEYDFKYTRRH